MDRKAPVSWEDEATASGCNGGSYNIGGFAMELRDRLLLLRTRVCASEKAVSHRGGISDTATGAGRVITVSSSLLSRDEFRPSIADCLPLDPDGCLPSRTDACRRTDGFLWLFGGVISMDDAGSGPG